MEKLHALTAAAAIFLTTAIAPRAQTPDPAGYVVLPLDREIALARSAAPDEVSENATIWALDQGRYRIAVEGANGNNCLVGRSLPQSLEPICYDAEASASALPFELRQFELRTAGLPPEAIEKELERALVSGELRPPSRPAMSYMMSSAQHLFDPETGRDAGNWKPHLMYFIPGLTEEDIGLRSPTADIMIFRPGAPMAHLIIVVPEFVDPEPSR